MRQFDETADVNRAIRFVVLVQLFGLEMKTMLVLDDFAGDAFLNEQTRGLYDRGRRGRSTTRRADGLVFAIDRGELLAECGELFLKVVQNAVRLFFAYYSDGGPLVGCRPPTRFHRRVR